MTKELQIALDNLAEVNKDYNEKAKYAFPKIISASRTIKLLVTAAENMETGWRGSARARAALNSLKRPPAVLTAIAFKKQ